MDSHIHCSIGLELVNELCCVAVFESDAKGLESA